MSDRLHKPRVAFFMTRDAYAKFCTMCDDRMKQKLVITNIQFNRNFRRFTDCGYLFMLEILPEYADRLWNMIKSDCELSTGTHDGRHPLKQMHNRKYNHNQSQPHSRNAKNMLQKFATMRKTQKTR